MMKCKTCDVIMNGKLSLLWHIIMLDCYDDDLGLKSTPKT